MFLGTYAPKLDDKGRVILPAKFRSELEAGLVVTRGQESCLYVYTSKEFENVIEQMRNAPVTSKAMRDYTRLFLSGASAETPDLQNRVSIPANLRSYAGLGRELTVIGVGNRAEIWDTAAWAIYYAEQEASFADTAEEVIPGIF